MPARQVNFRIHKGKTLRERDQKLTRERVRSLLILSPSRRVASCWAREAVSRNVWVTSN